MTGNGGGRSEGLLRRAAPFGGALAAVLLYAGTIDSPFVFDDTKLVAENEWIREPGRWLDFFRIASRQWDEEPVRINYRPVRFLSYGIDYQLTRLLYGSFPPDKPPTAVFHGVNIALHALNAFLVFAIIRRLLGGIAVPLVASLLFAAHPIQTEAVSYISGRRDVLSAAFFLGAVALFLRFRSGRDGRVPLHGIALIGVFFVAGYLTKELAITLPAILLLLDLIHRRRIQVSFHLPMFILALLAAGFTLLVKNPGEGAGYLGGSFWTSAMTMSRVLWMYIRLVVFPVGLSIDYSYDAVPVSGGILSPPATLLAFAGIGLGLAAAAVLLRKGKRVPFFGLAWFAVTLLPALQVFPHPERIAERFLHIPTVGAVLLAVLAWRSLLARDRALAALAAGIPLVLLALGTLDRNRDWADPARLWGRAVDVHPRCARAHLAFGSALLPRHEYRRAARAFSATIDLLPPELWGDGLKRGQALQAFFFRAQANATIGHREGSALHLSRAIEDYERLLREVDTDGAPIGDFPRYATIIFNLAECHRARSELPEPGDARGDREDAARAYRRVIALGPRIDLERESYFYLGVLAARAGETDTALELVEKALALAGSPGDRFRIRYHRAEILSGAKLWEDSVRSFEELLDGDLRPRDRKQVLYRLSEAYDRMARFDDAVRCLREAVAIDPSFGAALLTLGEMELRTGEYDLAEGRFRQVIEDCRETGNRGPGFERAVKGLKDTELLRAYRADPPEKKGEPGLKAGLEDLYRMAVDLASQRKWSDADDVLREVLQRSRKDPGRRDLTLRALDLLGRVRIGAGRLEEALSPWKELLDEDPSRRDVLRRLGDVSFRVGSLEEARGYYEAYLRGPEVLMEEAVEVALRLADIHERAGRIDEAIRALEPVAARGAKEPRIERMLGLLRYRSGEHVLARRHLERYADMIEDPEEIARIRAFIRDRLAVDPEKE